jgi:putative alpha-1,2-mannosidase
VQGGAFVRFYPPPDNTILARIGISFVNSAQACANAESEIPKFNFESTYSAAVNIWKEKLSPIRVSTEGVNSSLLTIFYSGIYRTMISPQDYTGENPLWASTEPYFDSFYWCDY